MPSWGIVGRIVLAYVHSQIMYRIWCQSVHPFGSFPRLKFVTPKTLRNVPCGIEGRIVFSYVHYLMNPQICTKFGANRSSRLTASPNIWICDPLPPPPNAPGVLWGELYLAYVHSQTNPPTCTKFGVNRCRRLTDSQYF